MKKFSFIIIIFIIFLLSYESIVSRAPNITETLFYLGLDSLIVGRTNYCDYPEEAKKIEIVGSYIGFDKEKLLRIRPDLVIFSNNLTGTEKIFLENYNINYTDIKMENIESIKSGIKNIAKRFNVVKKYDEYEDSLANIMKDIKKINKKIYVEISNKPIMGAGENSYIGDLLKLFDCEVFSSDNNPYFTVDQEELVEFNPDIIIVLDNDSTITNRIGWEKIEAVKGNNIILFNYEEIDVFSRPGPRLLEAIEILKNKFYENSK